VESEWYGFTLVGSHRAELTTVARVIVFASQGYVVVAINPTGSTSFGQSAFVILSVLFLVLMQYPRFDRGYQQRLGRSSYPRFVAGVEADPSGLPRGEVLYPVYLTSAYPDVELCTQIDQDRTVAAGASYGGYAIKYVLFPRHFALLILILHSWIQGNPELGFGFKALVCHDGVRLPSQMIMGKY
jgi:hypothetical protein